MTDLLIAIFVSLGTLFILLAAVGMVRMPDFYLRISVTTKAGTLGVGLILGGAAIYYFDFSITARVFAIIFFLLLTAPVAAHMIGRAAYFIGIEMWKKSVFNDLKDQYRRKTHYLESGESEENKTQKENRY